MGFRSVTLGRCFLVGALLSILSSGVIGDTNNTATTQKSNKSSTSCTPGTCRNGQCYVRASKNLCYCPPLFKGPSCQYVNMDKIRQDISGGLVIFQWPEPPKLQDYAFVYYDVDDPDSILYKNYIRMDSTQRAALVGNLKSGYTTYRVCIEDELLADRVISENSIQYLSNCVNVTTQPDYHTVAAWCIYAMLVCVAVFLIYWQKDKFELLYFSKPVFLMYDHNQEINKVELPWQSDGSTAAVKDTLSNSHLSNNHVTVDTLRK